MRCSQSKVEMLSYHITHFGPIASYNLYSAIRSKTCVLCSSSIPTLFCNTFVSHIRTSPCILSVCSNIIGDRNSKRKDVKSNPQKQTARPVDGCSCTAEYLLYSCYAL